MPTTPKKGPALLLALLLGGGWLALDRFGILEATGPAQSAPAQAADTDEGEQVEAVRAAFAAGRSDTWLEFPATVERLLEDDDEGSRHQRFVVRVAPDLTVLVAHNIDLAPRAPLDVGDRVRLRGEYEWNDRGGVLHWTHHDPGGRPGGWIEHGGRRYE